MLVKKELTANIANCFLDLITLNILRHIYGMISRIMPQVIRFVSTPHQTYLDLHSSAMEIRDRIGDIEAQIAALEN